MVRFALVLWSLIFTATTNGQGAKEPDKNTHTPFAKWEVVDKKLHLIINLETQLSDKQKTLINSGFSSYSEMEIYSPRAGIFPAKTIYKSKCTVKFDTWEERYELTRIDQKFTAESLKAFSDYSDLCLTAKVIDPEIIEKFSKEGGSVRGQLTINQISSDKSEEIKEWLIKQQSGVMQGLFSHMLGDLKLSEKESILIRIPSLKEAEMKPIKVNRLYPKKLGSNDF